MNWKRKINPVMTILLVLTLIGGFFANTPTQTWATVAQDVAPSEIPPSPTPIPSEQPLVYAPDSVPPSGLGVNVMRAFNANGNLLAEFRLINKTPDLHTFKVCIRVNGVLHCKTGSAPGKTEDRMIAWSYWAMFNLAIGQSYNMTYDAEISGETDHVIGERNVPWDDRLQIGMDVETECCKLRVRPRDDPAITITAGSLITTMVLAQDVWSGWVDVTSVATGEAISVVIEATWPGRAPSRDVVWVDCPCLQLGDRVWIDANANGRQDPGEIGLAGVVVTATGTLGSVVTTTTGLDGLYRFECLQQDTYTVTFGVPTGYVFTSPNVGDDILDSDAIGGIAVVVLTTDNLTIDAGVIPFNISSVICFCIEIRNGLNVIHLTLGDTANGRYAIYRGTTTILRDAVQIESFENNHLVGGGSHQWSDPQGSAASYYWLFEQIGSELNRYGPIRFDPATPICRAFIPAVVNQRP